MHSTIRILPCTVFTLLLGACAAAQEDGPSLPRDLTGLAYLKSPSGRFEVLGTDNLQNSAALRWAEDVARRVERTIGFVFPFEARTIRLSLREDSDGEARVATGLRLYESGIVQQLVLYNAEMLPRETAEEGLCRLLLAGSVMDGSPDRATPSLQAMRDVTARVPTWLTRGTVQDLYPARRARSSSSVLDRWQAGELPGLAAFLRGGGAQGKDPDPAMCGMVVGWLATIEDGGGGFRRALKQLGSGRAVTPEWFLSWMPGCRSIADLDGTWDQWILRQRRIVFEPGRTNRAAVQRLKAELLLYPGDSGIPLTSAPYRRIELHDLVALRRERWVRSFSDGKSSSLRILSAGRGEKFGNVVDLYCSFFEDLGKRKSARRLRHRLAKAEAGLAELESQLPAEERDNDPVNAARQ